MFFWKPRETIWRFEKSKMHCREENVLPRGQKATGRRGGRECLSKSSPGVYLSFSDIFQWKWTYIGLANPVITEVLKSQQLRRQQSCRSRAGPSGGHWLVRAGMHVSSWPQVYWHHVTLVAWPCHARSTCTIELLLQTLHIRLPPLT